LVFNVLTNNGMNEACIPRAGLAKVSLCESTLGPQGNSFGLLSKS